MIKVLKKAGLVKKNNLQKEVNLFSQVGKFAENKDIAQSIRIRQIMPALQEGSKVVIDYAGIDTTTQSFTHALISDPIRTFGIDILDRIAFKNCNETVKRIISIVIEYMQRSH